MKTRTLFFLLSLFLVIAIGCGSSIDDTGASSTEEAGSGNNSQVEIGMTEQTEDTSSWNISQVEIGMTEQEVIDLLGEPMGESENDITGENGIIYLNDSDSALKIWFKDGQVTKVESN